MAKTKLQLGRPVPIPEGPDKAVLDRVPNPQSGTTYVARFTFPEFTSLCPVTGQPDFGVMVIDYVPGKWLVENLAGLGEIELPPREHHASSPGEEGVILAWSSTLASALPAPGRALVRRRPDS